MSKLIALKFDDPVRAEEALARVRAATEADGGRLVDALTITWPDDTRRPKTQRPSYLTLPGKSVETLQNLAIGMLYIGLTISAGAVFFAGKLWRSSIGSDFLAEVRDQIASGTSILVLMVDEETGASVDTLLADMAPREIGTNSFTKVE
jgi:uncharacterized membrane protein